MDKNGMNDSDDGLLAGDPTQTASPAKGMDAAFNDAKAGDIGDDKRDPGSEASDGGGTSGFNDNPGL